MVLGLLVFLLFVVSFVAFALLQRNVQGQREAYIRSFELPMGLFEALRKKRPELSLKDCQLVAQGLRQFFLSHLKSQRRYVSMPSQVVDDLWHEFILFTRNYQVFCDKAFGQFLHHTPAVALQGLAAGSADNTDPIARSQAGLRRAWVQSCKLDNLNPQHPSRLPLLFALDAKLSIANGFHYQTVCTPALAGATNTGAGMGTGQNVNGPGQARVIYCGTDVANIRIENRKGQGCGGGCGSTLGSDAGGADGSGCGGGGCGGD